jgi:CheY-like chemotaxis protein
MSAKRALVVDDSKSARMFLSRILERHEIAVDAAESAEQAIEYLARHKPDVIFMDHMMPGMDGFQAVQTIKNNPRTSSIPILMYTSQEGDLYLGQARALGAEGVLPKQIKQADVTRMLYQLRLVSDRRGDEQNTFTRMAPSADLLPANEAAIVVTAPPAQDQPAPEGITATPAQAEIVNLLPQLSLEIRAALDNSLQKEIAALRGYIGTTLSAQTERLHGDLAVLLPAPRAPELDVPTMLPERRSWGAITGWSLALVATAGAAFMYWTWWNQGGEVAALRTDLAAAYTELETLRARPQIVSTPVPVASEAAIEGPVVDGAALVEAAAIDGTSAAVTPAAAVAGIEVASAPVVSMPGPGATPPADPVPAANAAAPRAQ